MLISNDIARLTPPSNHVQRAGTVRSMPLRRLALLIDTAGAFGRGIVQGVARYNRERGNWSTYFRPSLGSRDPLPAWLNRNWDGDGVLARLDRPEVADVVLRLGVPVVDLCGSLPNLPCPSVTIDNQQIAQLALEHLTERGLENFAYCGRAPRDSSAMLDRRRELFQSILSRSGRRCSVFPDEVAVELTSWEQEQQLLTDWIHALPKPLGIMACDDERGLQVLDACRRCGAAVPDDVAVIGVDNDESVCNLSIPPLSSVDVNAEGIGYEGAALLDRMMNGESASSRRPLQVAPRGVVTRRSTDVLASEDQDVGRAVRYIREHACRGVQVIDVLSHTGASRGSLQQRMKQTIGRTIHQEIQRVRLSRAKQLLLSSELTIKQVARQSGFTSVQYMTRVMRATTGETPARYRNSRAK